MKGAVPGKAICHFLVGLQKAERENFTAIYQILASYKFCFKTWGFFSLFLDQCHSLDFWRISPPVTEKNLVFFEIPVTVKGIVLVAVDRILSLRIQSQLLLSPLKSIFTRIFKFLTFQKYLFTLQMSADEGFQAKLLRLFLNIFLSRIQKHFKLYSSNLFFKVMLR